MLKDYEKRNKEFEKEINSLKEIVRKSESTIDKLNKKSSEIGEMNKKFFRWISETKEVNKEAKIELFKDQAKFGLHEMLKFSAKFGHGELCTFILNEIAEKNPKDETGRTPLHIAAEFGNLDVCKMIMDEIKDKSSNGITKYERKLALLTGRNLTFR